MTTAEAEPIPGNSDRPLLLEPDTGTDTVLGSRYRALTLAMVSVVLLIAFEATAVGTAMPVAARELDGLPLYAFAFSGYFTTSLFAMVVSGQWSDRSGPLAPLVAGIGAFAAGLLISGAAQSMWLFVLGRAVQGIGGGLVIVALYVVVSLAYPERLRPAVMAGFAASWVLPSIVGPLVAGTVTEQFGWRWVFLSIPVLIVPPLLIGLPAMRRMPVQPPPDDRRAPDGRRIRLALAVSAGAGLLQYAGQDLRPLSLVLAAAGAALIVPAALELLPRGTIRAARGLPSVVLLRGVASGTFLGAETFVPLMLVTQRHLSPTLAGLSLASGGITWGIGSWIQGRPRLEPYRDRMVVTGMFLMAAAIAGAALPLVSAAPVWSAAAAWAVGGLGAGLVISSLSVILFKLSAPSEAGANSAALQVSDALASVVLVAAAGTAFAALGGATGAFAAVFLPLAALSLAGVAVAARLRPKSG